ncbi:MAG TPA: RNA polymerase sigma factor [Polyangiaceae bacterium]|jgi:RNA polymerase sigma-70 factor (ECF subfamily)
MSNIVDQVVPWARRGGHVTTGQPTDVKLPEQDARHSFEFVYRSCYVPVARWVRALGANDGDVEDLTQEIFIIVRRKLSSFDGRNLPGWLYRIAQRTVRDHRRSAWFRNVLGKQATAPEPTAPGPSGFQVLHQRERRKVLESILARMSEKRRTTFVLFEIEGYSGEEIAQIQSLRLKTVWTRLHHARKDFLRMVAELPASEGEE